MKGMGAVRNIVAAPTEGSLNPVLRERWLRAIETWMNTLEEHHGLEEPYLEFLSAGIESLQGEDAEVLLPSLCELETDPDPCRVGTALSGVGTPGSWTFSPLPSTTAHFGPYRLELRDSIQIRHDGGAVRVTSGAQPSEGWTFHRPAGAWMRSNGTPSRTFQLADRSVPILRQGDLTLSMEPSEKNEPPRYPPEEVVRTFEEAAALMAAASPEYTAWVAHVLRAVEVVETDGTKVESGSNPSKPGSISFTYPLRADHLATLLVHEAAHQYLHQYHAALPVVDVNDTRRYFSPFRRTERPLYGILLAFHAAVNILVFIDRALPLCEDSGFLTDERKELRQAIDQMLPPMRDAPGLTATGREIVQDLRSLVE